MAKNSSNKAFKGWIGATIFLVVAVVLTIVVAAGSAGFKNWDASQWFDGWGKEQTIPDDKHEHSFENGICTICEYECEHEYNGNYECKICGYKHKHTYSTEWTRTSKEHWNAATCGHATRTNLNTHTYENGVCTRCKYECKHEFNGNYECTICGYKHAHTYSNAWTSDAEEHWHTATCGHGYRTNVTAHTFGDNHKCTVCGYQGKHTFSEEWSYGERNHYHASTCEHDMSKDVAPHTFEDSICTVCGYEKPEDPHVHEYSEEWSSDTKNHFHAATCGHNVIKDTAAHTYENGVCTVCGYEMPEEPHTHAFSNEWSNDSINHWHSSTCEHKTVKDMAAHTYANGSCTVCGYECNEHTYDAQYFCTICGFKHVHTFSNEWSKGTSNHWHSSTCDHDISRDVAAHTFEDGICTVCGYASPEDPHVHEYSEEWSSDTKNHFHAATCGHNVIKDTAAHTYENEVCTVCGYEMPEEPHTHTFSDELSNDAVNHWYTTTCEHKIVKDMAAHTYANGVCTVCGYEEPDEPHTHTFSNEWSNDAVNHWHTATCGHKIVYKMAAHTYEDGACTVCGRVQG